MFVWFTVQWNGSSHSISSDQLDYPGSGSSSLKVHAFTKVQLTWKETWRCQLGFSVRKLYGPITFKNRPTPHHGSSQVVTSDRLRFHGFLANKASRVKLMCIHKRRSRKGHERRDKRSPSLSNLTRSIPRTFTTGSHFKCRAPVAVQTSSTSPTRSKPSILP